MSFSSISDRRHHSATPGAAGRHFFILPTYLLLLLLQLLLLSSAPRGAWGQPQQPQRPQTLPKSQVFRTWAARSPTLNCSCTRELSQLKKELEEEREQRQGLKGSLETYVSELYELRAMVRSLKNSSGRDSVSAEKYSSNAVSSKRTPAISFSAKLSYNREMKPLDTVIFDTIITNNGEGYNAETGKFTAPLPGTYVFFATVLSGYNTKVETALIVNDKEVARIYSGAHDAHGSGSNAAITNLKSGDSVWVRLLYQGGNHVHGYYSTFSGAILTEEDQ